MPICHDSVENQSLGSSLTHNPIINGNGNGNDNGNGNGNGNGSQVVQL